MCKDFKASSLACQASFWPRTKDVRWKEVTTLITTNSRSQHPSQVCRGRDACAGDQPTEEVPPLVPPLPRLHRHLLCEQTRQAAQVALSCKVQRRQPGWDRAQVTILGLKFGFIVTEVPIWIEAVTMTMIIWDAMISPHTMYHNQVVVTSAAMMSSSEALPGGKGAEKSDWCVTGWSIGCCTGTGTGATVVLVTLVLLVRVVLGCRWCTGEIFAN